MAAGSSDGSRLAHRSVVDTVNALPTHQRSALPTALADDERLIVIDDDPTGSQAVHGVQVIAGTDRRVVEAALRESSTVFFLSNARALVESDAVALLTEMAAVAASVCADLGLRPLFASRSDSTLRGHFPADVAAIAAGAQLDPTVLLVPCFVEGGRWTIDDVHWVRDGDELVPVGQTPYAQDASFGFSSSRLDEWVAEKTGGAMDARSVALISLTEIRCGDTRALADELVRHRGTVIAVNAVDNDDLEELAEAVRLAEAAGVEFVYRTGASFVRARSGIETREALGSGDIRTVPESRGGLIVCGSHVPLTTAQIDELISRSDCVAVEIEVDDLVSGERAQAAVRARVGARIREIVHSGRHAVAFTSRRVVDPPAGMTALELAKIVSTAVVDITKDVRGEVGFLVSKGGITSHDVATKALELERGTVLGQVIPGVSVWRVDVGAVPGQVLVVFPGNVGGPASLSEVLDAIVGDRKPAPGLY